MIFAPLAVSLTSQLATSALPHAVQTAAGENPASTRSATAAFLRRTADRIAAEPAVLAPR